MFFVFLVSFFILGCNWAPIVPFPSIFFGTRVKSLRTPSLSIVIDIGFSNEFWISFTKAETAWSPASRVMFLIFKILSPASNPAREAALLGWVAKTKMPGSGSKGIPTVPTFIISWQLEV